MSWVQTTNTTNREVRPHRSSEIYAGDTIVPPCYDPNADPTGPRTATTTNREARPPRPPPKADYYDRSEDREGVDSGWKEPTRYPDRGGQRTQGDEERKKNVLRKSTPSSKKPLAHTERKELQSSSLDSINITMGRRDSHFYSPVEKASKATAMPANMPVNVQPRSRLGTRHVSYSRTSQLPPGAQPPFASRHRGTQPGKADFIDGHSTQPPSHVVDDSAHDSTQFNDEELDSSHPQSPRSLSTTKGHNVQVEGAGVYTGVTLGPGTGLAQPPRDRTTEKLQRTEARLRQLEYEFRRVKGENATLHRMCFELDGESRKQKDTIQSLQRELTKLTNEPQTTSTDNESESLSAARAILDGTGATPVMAVIDAMLILYNEIVNVSNFLAKNIRHTSYELFQEELDRCYQDSEKIIGERLSKFLHDHSEAEELSQSLIKITIQIFITSFCASGWDRYLDTPLLVEADKNVAKNYNERKAAFLRNLISIFKIAAWMIPGSASRAAFEESLNPFFKSLEEIEAALTKVPEFTRVWLSFVSPGEDLADFETYADSEEATEPGIPTSNEPSPSPNTVLGTVAFGVHCLFHDQINGVDSDKPRIVIAARVILEENLRYIFGIQENQKPAAMSNRSASQAGDGRDP